MDMGRDGPGRILAGLGGTPTQGVDEGQALQRVELWQGKLRHGHPNHGVETMCLWNQEAHEKRHAVDDSTRKE